jgi:oligopeptide/dipeptide ABC transporter ATP-binding protein
MWSPSRARIFAVDDVSFSIDEGETVGLVGESGCGKSTLARLLARLLDLSAGEIRFRGADIGTVPARRFGRAPQRADIQVVFQDPTDSLTPRFTAFDLIADPIRRLRPSGSAAVRAQVIDIARMCGLPADLLGRFPHQLSGGQKARVGIARALGIEPRLVILDEPTSSLDVSVQVVILHLLQDLKQRLGLSYLFVSHDLNIVRLLCNRVLVMYAGKIVESGATPLVFNRPGHPYTSLLLSAIPDLVEKDGRTRIVIEGEPASPVDPDPRVCRFYGRCPKGKPECTAAMPDLVAIEPGHAVACHFASTNSDEDAREQISEAALDQIAQGERP